MPTLRGRVVSGLGDFSYWMARLADHYTRKTGLVLFPGTLNLELDSPYRLPPEVIRLEKEEYGGRVSVSLVPCRVFGRSAFLVRTDLNESGNGPHPHTIVEIAANVSLRQTYGLSDGSIVEVEI